MTDTPTPGRGPGRRFKKGQSGNPGGRPKVPAELRGEAQMLALQHVPRAIERLAQLAENRKAPTVALAACTALIDRGLGRPETTTTLQGRDGEPLFPKPKNDLSEDIEVARNIAFILSQGMRAVEQAPEITHTNTGDTPL